MRSSEHPSILHYFGANKSFRMNSYRRPTPKSFRMRSSEKWGGRGTSALKIKLQRQLNLPRIEHRPWRPIQRIRRPFQVAIRRGTAECRGIHRAEIRRAVHRVEKSNVSGVKQVERLRDQFQASFLAEGNRPPDAEVHRTEIVAHKRVARFDSNAVVVPENVTVGVE